MMIRSATGTDLPGILGIYNEAVLNTTATYEYEPHTLEMRKAWFDEHVRDNYPVFVAQNGDGRIVGWSCLSKFRPRTGYRFTGEDSIYVAADQRGRGIGKSLLQPVIQSARDLGLHAVIAGIDAGGRASIRLHAHFGFVQVAHLKEAGWKFGRWLDMIYMELLLNGASHAPSGSTVTHSGEI
jgi:L-amino acid N-acyltransferase YncA